MPDALVRHVKKLSTEIGARPGGSPANWAAAHYIESVFRQCGMAVEMQDFACPTWEELGAWLCFDNTALTVAANAFSPSCLVTAPTLLVGSLAELETADLCGQVAVLHGDFVRSPLPPKAWTFKGPEETRVVELLEEKAPAAIVTVQARAGSLERLIEDWEFSIPSVTVPAHVGELLCAHAGEPVRLRIDSRRTPGSTANVVGRLHGACREQLVICAHYDTKIDTPGATDNATGVAVMLALAERLCREDQPYSLEFVAFTNEEYMPVGDDEYVRRRADGFGHVHAAMNFDAVGLAAGPNTIAAFNLPPETQHAVDQVVGRFPNVAWTEPWPESNHSTFAIRGVPTLAFTARADNPSYHLRSDTVELVSPERLAEMVDLGASLVAELACRTPVFA